MYLPDRDGTEFYQSFYVYEERSFGEKLVIMPDLPPPENKGSPPLFPPPLMSDSSVLLAIHSHHLHESNFLDVCLIYPAAALDQQNKIRKDQDHT